MAAAPQAFLTPSPSATELAGRYRLLRDRPPSVGLAGAQLARGSGSSVDFHDRRPYHPGDDLRRLDWRAYARTDKPYVQLYREELEPRVEIFVDVSRSLAVDPAKAQLAVDLAAFFAAGARADGAPTSIWMLGDEALLLPTDALFEDGVCFEAVTALGASIRAVRPHLRAGASRVLISDFLSPFSAGELVRSLSSPTSTLGLIQVLGTEDLAPPLDRALRLIDSETGDALELILDAPRVAAYRARLERLRDGLLDATRGAGARLASLSAEHPLEHACREALIRSQLITAR